LFPFLPCLAFMIAILYTGNLKEISLTYLECKIDPVKFRWDQEMIDNPNAKFCFVFDARNVFRELTDNGNQVLSDIIKRAVDVYCKDQGVDTWYYPNKADEHCHLLYTSTSSWIVMLRMMKSTEPNFDNYLLRHIDSDC
jgi:hypothetical protein